MLVPSETYYNLILEVVHIDKTALRTPTKPNYTTKQKKKKNTFARKIFGNVMFLKSFTTFVSFNKNYTIDFYNNLLYFNFLTYKNLV